MEDFLYSLWDRGHNAVLEVIPRLTEVSSEKKVELNNHMQRVKWTYKKQTHACRLFLALLLFLPPHNSPLPFPAYNGPKVLLSVDTASIHVYSSLTSAKRSPSYTLLVKDTYCWDGTWPLPPLLPASTHAVPTRCSERREEKRRWCTGSLLTVSHTKDKNTERNQASTWPPSPWERGAHHIDAALFLQLQQQ